MQGERWNQSLLRVREGQGLGWKSNFDTHLSIVSASSGNTALLASGAQLLVIVLSLVTGAGKNTWLVRQRKALTLA